MKPQVHTYPRIFYAIMSLMSQIHEVELEKVQRKVERMIKGVKQLSYRESLCKPVVFCLEKRRHGRRMC